MDIVEKEENGVCHLLLDGRLDSNTSLILEQKLVPLCDAEGSKILVDLSSLRYISSAGLRVFLMAAKRARKRNARIVLAGMSENVKEVFDIAGFSRMLQIEDDQAAARAALG